MRQTITVYLLLVLGTALAAQDQSQKEITNEEIARRVAAYKSDARGPYKEIRWYCKDGTILPPQQRCPQPGGVQRARHKEEVYALALNKHVFLGQILATTPFQEFWDQETQHSRMIQYQMEKYLQAIDNGWILRKAQFYRGAFQAEDETSWGIEFYQWLLANDEMIQKNYFLIRQSLKDIPHMGDDNLTQEIRAVSKLISETYSPFLDLRVKIHGQPDETDLKKVELFRENHKQKLDPDQLDQFDTLIRDMKELYKPLDPGALNKYLDQLPVSSSFKKHAVAGLSAYSLSKTGNEKIGELSGLLLLIREEILSLKEPGQRLAALDLSLALEDMMMRELSGFTPGSIRDQLETLQSLGSALAGCGYLEAWEWKHQSDLFMVPSDRDVPLQELLDHFEAGRRISEWGVAMFRSQYNPVANLYGGFEPMANGFLDDRVRSSLLLYCGIALNRLDEALKPFRPSSNQVMDLEGQHAIRGLNPGYAVGELVVVTGQTEHLVVDRSKIYVFNNPPPDLKPVAGIATVTEGNVVSHVQLLARNLGIPNAVLSPQNLEDLKKYSGQQVFYAVSPGGTVVLKPRDQSTPEELNLIETRKRVQDKILVPVQKINLNQRSVLSLSAVSSESSGILCGPKAANLGQLKLMFPDHVVNGLVIPFGIFRAHLDQAMPGQAISYWQYLNDLFARADQMRQQGGQEEKVEAFMLTQLEIFRKSIREIELQETFLEELKKSFQAEFGHDLGKQAVFLRSDTNMEDLKEFTGAGLNLTLFNVVEYEKIIQGIRDVWASPYTERSYKWRQQYLLNPENVFPSILIIPTVDVDISGVMVTWGISNQDENDLTLAFNRGAGGAVDGQAAESYLITKGGKNILLSPAREPSFIRLPSGGGSQKHRASFEQAVLSEENIRALRKLADQVKRQLPDAPGIETDGPFDIELGFKDNKLWLFQVRPFVENKNAAASEYLNSLNPVYDGKIMIPIR